MQSVSQKRGLSESEAASYVGLSRSSLRQGRMDGHRDNRLPPPPYVRLGRKILYLRDDLDRWLEQYRVEPAELYGREVPHG
jgi:predicted DNA-binding transcriptional regulator AlpA